MIQDRKFRTIGKNVEALRENIKNEWYITFKNERGEPLLIFAVTKAAIMHIKQLKNDMVQLLFRISETYYILSFWDCVEAKRFSDALLKFITILYMKYVPVDVRDCFQSIQTAFNSLDA